MAGETGPISASLPVDMVIAGFFAVACYNCVEILVSLLNRFKRRDGLYFWSMTVATLGIVLHSVVVLLRYYSLGPNFPLCVLTCLGWYGMVTGQSVVLYSRLHLVVPDRAKTRWVLIMIIVNFCILHVPVTILFLGSNTPESHRFLPAFNVYERIQLAGFFLQESVISGLYIYETARGLKPIFAIKRAMERKVMRHMITVNVVVILLDVSLLVTQYLSHFQIATTYKPVVYSIKLKMEFVVLNKLLLLVQHSECNCAHVVDRQGEEDASGPSHLECPFDRQGPRDNGIQLDHVPSNAPNAPPPNNPQNTRNNNESPFAWFDMTDPCYRKETPSRGESNISTRELVHAESVDTASNATRLEARQSHWSRMAQLRGKEG